MNDDEAVLIYSSESGDLRKKNKKNQKPSEIVPSETTIKLRIEKSGRGGKSVTVLYELPDNPPYFKKLLKELKGQCGTGGTQKETTLEIQGDQREKIRAYLNKKGFLVKG